MAAASGQEREVQKSYWIEHTAELTVEAMMLDSKAADLDKEERPEVLSLLPPYEGKTVLELGAGIGRFTGELAQKAGQLIALDFIEGAIKKNENINGHYKNVKFMCADVTSPNLIFSPESVDLIFSNWLLMYLSDEEVKALVERMVIWLKVGGHIFFRESCFHQSGDHKRKNNPTHYRDPSFYTKVFRECHVNAGDGKSFELSLAGCKCIGAYVKNKKNQNQICWTWQKVTSKDDMEFQRFLDTVQYKCSGILRYERVFGQGFVSTGGLETTKEFVAMLDLQRGQKVLDVGCGIGGGNFYMAEKYDVHVVGIDLSINMISFALEGILNDTGIQFFNIIRIGKQLEYFEQYQRRVSGLIGAAQTEQLVNSALILITLGGNDFVNNYYLVPFSARSRQFSLPDYVVYLISEYRKILQKLYDLGGRRVLVTGTGPIGCVPAELAQRSRSGECSVELQRAAALFNPQLTQMLADLNSQIGANVFIAANTYTMNMDFVSNPQAYGFVTSKIACCGQGPYNGIGLCTPLSNLCPNRDIYAFWDPFHPSERANRIIVQQILTGSSQYMSPMNLSTIMALDSRT